MALTNEVATDSTLPSVPPSADVRAPEFDKEFPEARLPALECMGYAPCDSDGRPGENRAGEYVLGDVLARGGFGVVYRAEHARHGGRAAVKVLDAELANRPDVLIRFKREIEAIQRVRHPHVVEIFDFGQLRDGRPYFVMELLDGVDLEHHLCVRGRLPFEEVIAILKPLCDALDAAHAQRIVHRDVKASNVFLCEEEKGLRVVLLDFGVAKLLDAPGPALTSSRHVVGTPACIAPEQLLSQPVDARTDVYALGALAFTMLTGEQPFGVGSYYLLRQLHLYATAPRPSVVAPVTPAFDDVILRAMNKAPSARYPSAGAFLAAMVAAAEEARGAAAAAPASRSRRALGIYVELLADMAALEDPDERFLTEFESILPRARDELSPAGFWPVVEAGASMLLVALRPDDPARDEAARRAAVDAARAAYRRAQRGHDGHEPRVRVRLCIHAGEFGEGNAALEIPRDDLRAIAAWVPAETEPGVFASPGVLAGLGLSPGDEDAREASVGEFVRIAGAPLH